MAGGNVDHYTAAELRASLRSCLTIIFSRPVCCWFVDGFWGRGRKGVSERVVVSPEGSERTDDTTMGGAGLNFTRSACLCAAVLSHNSSSYRRHRLSALNYPLARAFYCSDLQLLAVMHVSYAVRAHTQLPAVDLKSTPLTTRTN